MRRNAKDQHYDQSWRNGVELVSEPQAHVNDMGAAFYILPRASQLVKICLVKHKIHGSCFTAEPARILHEIFFGVNHVIPLGVSHGH